MRKRVATTAQMAHAVSQRLQSTSTDMACAPRAVNADEANGEYGCIVEDGREMFLDRCDECASACNAKTLAQPAGPIEEGCEDGGVNGGSAENVPALSGCARAAGNVESAMDREYRTQRQTLA
ncbi:hypothetical protein EW145_g2144 [Phellinidium pouzarii]|uniref:Uncharacterized protein n=1 Tax=Phellinidium pouzarii TaxID=167371 RepID=A0A4S4LDP8_9AGAM|nr:hypothetical protein EW145_g2144 [Phellinidium pouzarii]